MSNEPSSSRSSSLAGQKRPRESDADAKLKTFRRTKSAGESRSTSKDREALQRGLIAVFVPNALRESLQARMDNYNDLLKHFLPTPMSPVPPLPPLLPLLRALTAHVSLLSPDVHGALVSAIIRLPWAMGEEKFVKVFIGWAGVLVSAHPAWAKEVVGMAVKGLAWRPRVAWTAPISRRITFARHHFLLAHLLSLIPTLPSIIQPLVIRHFPNKREPEVAQTTWVRNCSEMVGYCPELGGRVWGEIVDRMLRIDVEITRREEEDDDESDDDDAMAGSSQPHTPIDPFDLLVSQDVSAEAEDSDDESDPDIDELSSADGDSDSDDSKSSAKMAADKLKRREAVREMRSKLDGMLTYFLEHLEGYVGARRPQHAALDLAAQQLATANSSGASTPTSEFPPSSFPVRAPPTAAQSLAHFQTLLNLFTRQVLATPSTQNVPFLLFYASSLSSSHTDLFLGLLVAQALYGTTSTTISATATPVSLHQRCAAAVYIGSVVTRARFVTDDQARLVMTYLLAYLDSKMHHARSAGLKHVDEMPLVYALCQSAMLIFCFRWRAFLKDSARAEGESVLGEMELEIEPDEAEGRGGDEGKWWKELDVLQRLLTSDINPLLGCNPTVVTTFARVAHHTNFAYCFSIIEANSQSSRSFSSHSLTTTPHHTSVSRQNSTSSANNPSITLPKAARQINIDAGLDAYFPFDPYELPRSSRYVEPIYRTWQEVSVDEDDEDDEDEDEDETESSMPGTSIDAESMTEDRLSVPSGRSLPKAMKSGSYGEARRRILSSSKDGGLSSSLEGMSISPLVG